MSRATAWSRWGWRSTSTTSACRPPTSPAARATRRWRPSTTAAAASRRSSTRSARWPQGALDEVQAQGLRPIGATVALPGLVDIQRGALLVAPNLHWSDVPVVELLRERIDAPSLPLGVDNEANLAALAELWEGAATGYSDFVYASGEIGVGGGIVLGGELFRGYRGFGGEFGHTTVEADGLPCACGSRGCLETRAGLEPLLAAAGIDGDARDARGPGKPVAELVRRAQDGRRRGARGAGRLRSLARRRAGHRGQPPEPAGDRPRRPLRADDASGSRR